MSNLEKLSGLVLTIVKAYLWIWAGVSVYVIGMIIGLFIRFNSITEVVNWFNSLLNTLNNVL